MADPDAKAVLREALEGLGGDGNDLGRMEDSLPVLAEFLSALATPDFVCVMAGLPPTPPTLHPGIEGLASAWADYGGAFETVRAELQEILESDSHLVVLVNQVGITRHGGVEISQPSAMLFAFEGGRVGRIEFHLDQAQALRIAGLDPRSAG